MSIKLNISVPFANAYFKQFDGKAYTWHKSWVPWNFISGFGKQFLNEYFQFHIYFKCSDSKSQYIGLTPDQAGASTFIHTQGHVLLLLIILEEE